jgi:HD-GYP domain-containing protein (c-di-GMP phosphodiesterase class II)
LEAAPPLVVQQLREPEKSEGVFQGAVATLEDILQAVKTQPHFAIASAAAAVAALLQSLEGGDTLLLPVFRGDSHVPSPAREAVHVCILALKLGLELGYAPAELRKLGLAALLSDLGMARMPETLLARHSPLNAAERSALRRSPVEAARVIEALGPQYRWLAEVLLQVHERMDGSGYPQGLKGGAIQDYAYIVGLADLYESLVHRRPFRLGLGPVEALKEILHRERQAFPERIIRALIRALTTFPVGSLVRLNTSEIGRVMAENKEFPLRPVVEVLVRQGQRPRASLMIDLANNPLLYIQESVSEEALAQEATGDRA